MQSERGSVTGPSDGRRERGAEVAAGKQWGGGGGVVSRVETAPTEAQ